MNRLVLGLAAAVSGLVFVPNLATALTAVTTGSTELRAGPAYDFPVVDQIPADVRVDVHGCVRGYRWCDVSWRDARGWVPGEELAYLYQDRRVTIVEYGPRIGLPVIAFSFDGYWDRHYRRRSWYNERVRWRSVWRERERGERTSGDRVRDRREDRADDRVKQRQEAEDRVKQRREAEERVKQRREAVGRQGEGERRFDGRGKREERPDVRTGRGDGRDRGESRGYLPQNPGPRRDIDRGMRQSDPNPAGRPAPSMQDRSPGGRGGPDRGGPGAGDRGERRPN